MLSTYTPIATVPTADLGRARTFYEQTLGLAGAGQDVAEGVRYTCGASGFLLYQSQYAGTNQATTMTFLVDDGGFDAEVARLRDAGITFDTFEMEGLDWVEGVATMDGGRSVWFRDPDGNILNLASMEG
ncbi:MAG: VOC family protein [Candidatus Nanopelagicales bacterium]|jgi:catechol 2,3-dioxygenase-like lactoylglutathione lyase family enzyme|nr:VOC family protein [Candidatus Nanopelagicales bacterium]